MWFRLGLPIKFFLYFWLYIVCNLLHEDQASYEKTEIVILALVLGLMNQSSLPPVEEQNLCGNVVAIHASSFAKFKYGLIIKKQKKEQKEGAYMRGISTSYNCRAHLHFSNSQSSLRKSCGSFILEPKEGL